MSQFNKIRWMFLHFLCFSVLSHAQILRGHIYEYTPNGDMLKLDGVNISTEDHATATVTKSDGSFRLDFIDKTNNERTNLKIEKKDWLVINNEDVKNVALTQNNEMVPILMCKCDEKQRLRLKMKYYVGDAIEKEYKKNYAELSAQLGKVTAKSKEWQTLFNRQTALLTEKEALLKDVKELSEYVADLSEKQNSDLIERMIQLFQNGQIRAAFNIASNSKIDQTILINRQKLKDIKQSAIIFYLKAEFASLLFMPDSADFNFQKAIEFDGQNLRYYNDYTKFLKNFGHDSLALKNIKTTLRRAEDIAEASESLPNLLLTEGLAYAYYYQQSILSNALELDRAQEACQKALIYFDILVRTDEKYRLMQARTMSDMGQIGWRKEAYEVAVEWYQKALQTYALVKVEESDALAFQKSYTFNGLSSAWSGLLNFDVSLRFSDSAIQYRKNLFSRKGLEYAQSLGEALSNQALTFEDNKQYEQAAAAYDSAAYYYGLLLEKNPKMMETKLLRLYQNSSLLYAKMRKREKFEENLHRAEVIHQKRLVEFPKQILNLANYYLLIADVLEGNQPYTEGVKWRESKIQYFQNFTTTNDIVLKNAQKALVKMKYRCAESFCKHDSSFRALSIYDEILPEMAEKSDSEDIFRARFYYSRAYINACSDKPQMLMLYKIKALEQIAFLEKDLLKRDSSDRRAGEWKQSVRSMKSFFSDLTIKQIEEWKKCSDLNNKIHAIALAGQRIPQREQYIVALDKLGRTFKKECYFLTYQLLLAYREQSEDQIALRNNREAAKNAQNAYNLNAKLN